MSNREARGRGWAFTINNYTEAESLNIQALVCDYAIVGKEVGAEGTPHLQGYIYYSDKATFKSVKSALGDRAHIEVAKASAEQNRNYCVKQGNILCELGTLPQQGKRTDLDVVKKILKETGRVSDVVTVVTSYQSIRAAEVLIRYIEPKRNTVPQVIWLWGPTGTGKTRIAVDLCGPDVWMSGRNLKWWDGYDGHKNVIIDDFRGDFCSFHELLRILDRYEYRIEVKGGSRQLLATKIIITSCSPPDKVYYTREDIGQLLRRITETRYVGCPVVQCPEVGGNTIPPTSDDIQTPSTSSGGGIL